MAEVATPKDAHEVQRLRREIIAWLATTRPDGHPNLTPVWFLWEDPTILIFSQPNKPKLRNIGQNPHVMLGLETALPHQNLPLQPVYTSPVSKADSRVRCVQSRFSSSQARHLLFVVSS